MHPLHLLSSVNVIFLSADLFVTAGSVEGSTGHGLGGHPRIQIQEAKAGSRGERQFIFTYVEAPWKIFLGLGKCVQNIRVAPKVDKSVEEGEFLQYGKMAPNFMG